MKIFARTTDINKTEVYILPQQKDDPKEEQIKWHIRTALTAAERQHIRSMYGSDSHQANKEALHIALSEVSNFFYDDGEPVEIGREGKKRFGLYFPLNKNTLDALPEVAIDELGLWIVQKIMELGDEDVKNS